jgi:prephenate dehydratase
MKTAAKRSSRSVAFQGELGAFSQQAVRQLLGPSTSVVPCIRFEDIFRNLKDGNVAGAMVPIENTLAGSVHENYDHLLHFELPIVAETSVRIVHNLIAPKGVAFRQLKRVFSHPVALNQCLDFFLANPQIERIPYYDTAGSAKMVVEEGLTDSGAIASAVAAEIYGAHILRKSIESDRQNFTRFFLLRTPEYAKRHPARVPAGTVWKTTLVFSTRNIPGALFRALSAFALRDLNCTKIESRPLRGKPYEYLFYLDFLGHVDHPSSQNALRNLEEITDFLRVLGCYPKGA